MTAATARTSLGPYVGMVDDGVAVHRGIPYARAPVGPLRFAPPQRIEEHFAAAREATRDGPIAPQLPSRLSAVMGDFSRPSDEDCLTLTVWAPEQARDLPVLAWVHGGAWMSGAGSLDWYDGSRLAREGGMVVVGINYRLGALGYLHAPGVSPGNLGTLDVAAALGWIAREIAAFGGDPAAVTVCGQSAGASTIGRLIADPAARPLFRRAILQSGGFGRDPLSPAVATERAGILARELGIDLAADDAAARFREVPVPALLAAQTATARAIAAFADTTPPFTPVLEEGGSAQALLLRIAGAADGLDLMIGSTRDEAHAFFGADAGLLAAPRDRLAARAAALTGAADALDRQAARRPGGTQRDAIADVTTDAVYRDPALRLTEAVAGRGGRPFVYQFDWAPPHSPFGACHCIELPFVFGTFNAYGAAPMLAGGDPAQMQALSAAMRRAWSAFVHAGDPNHPRLPPWRPYEAPARSTMIFGRTIGPAGNPAGLKGDFP